MKHWLCNKAGAFTFIDSSTPKNNIVNQPLIPMRSIVVFITAAVMLFILFHFINLSHKAPKESYPEDSWLSMTANKTALVIVAHDDDAIGAAGTVLKLTASGWTVKELCFYNTVNDEEKNERIRQRQLDTEKVKEIEGLSEFRFFNLPFRYPDKRSVPEYMPIAREELPLHYNTDTLLYCIRKFIDENNPSVIFTLDNAIGGYGHSDHLLVSQLVLDECNRRKNDSGFAVKYIYQAVFTPSMAENILTDLPPYNAALKIYKTGIPLPDVQVTITQFGSKKKEVMKAYSTEQNSIRKIWPSYQYYPAAIYFRLFDREFFKIIKLK